jgi:peptide/nickel transport system ATP-binding protein
MSNKAQKGDVLLDIKGLKIQGFSDEKWHDIIKELI